MPRSIPGFVLALGVLLAIESCCDGGGIEMVELDASAAPERFVMATVPSSNSGPDLLWSTLEVRMSPNGTRWSAPAYPLKTDCGVPVPVDPTIAPAVASTPTHYLAAAYGPTGTIFFSKSRNGVQWTAAETATTIEEDRTSRSRPAVVYDREEETWYAIVTTVIGNPGGEERPWLVDLDGETSRGARARQPDWEADWGVSVAYTGVPGLEYIFGGQQASAVVSSSPPQTDCCVPAVGVYDALPFELAPGLSSDGFEPTGLAGSPWVSSSLTQIFAATNRNEIAGGPSSNLGDNLVTGVTDVWQYDVDAASWSRLVSLPAVTSHEGAAVAGILSNMVVASPGPNRTTEVWHLAPDSTGVLRGELRTIPTRSSKSPAVAFGPKRGGRTFRNVCDEVPGDGVVARDVFLRFRQFRRTRPPDIGDFDDAEDVELRVAHATEIGFVDQEYDADPNQPGVQPKVVRNATKNQSHFFDEGFPRTGWPEFRLLLLPGEVVEVTLTGDEGPTTAEITWDELTATQPGGVPKNTTTLDEDGEPGFLLDYDATVADAQ